MSNPRPTLELASQLDESCVPDFCKKSTLILGCGNKLFGDDGFGCAVIEYVAAHHQVPETVCLLDVGTGIRNVLFTLCLSPMRPRLIVILDAIDLGRAPGEVFEILCSEIPLAKLDDFCLHQLPTSNLLRELEEMCGVEIKLLVCQTGPLPEQVYEGLSQDVRLSVPKAAEYLIREWRLPHRNASLKASVEHSTASTATKLPLRQLRS